MAFDPVPWALNNADTQAAEARVLAYIASRGSQGIVQPTDFKVTQLGTPGGAVQIGTGGLVVPNAQAPGESYVGTARSVTTQSISPTTSSARSDLILARVIDPDFAPWQPYTDPNMIANGPYFEPFVISGVSSSTTKASDVVSYSAYALARIDIPNNTTNILDAMIHDLRQLAQPRISQVKAVHIGPGSLGTPNSLPVTQTTFTNWPLDSLQVTVPTWATHCMASIRINQVQVDNHASDFVAEVAIGNLTGAGVNFDYNGNAGDNYANVAALPFEIFTDINVTSLQGQTVTVKPQAERTFTANTGSIWITNQQQVIYDLTFVERTL